MEFLCSGVSRHIIGAFMLCMWFDRPDTPHVMRAKLPIHRIGCQAGRFPRAVFEQVSRQLRVLKPRVIVRVVPYLVLLAVRLMTRWIYSYILLEPRAWKKRVSFALEWIVLICWNHIILSHLFSIQLLVIIVWGIHSISPSHHYIFIHRQTLGLSTQRVSDCPTGHESAHRIRPSSAPPPRWLESERSTWVNNNFLLVLWKSTNTAVWIRGHFAVDRFLSFLAHHTFVCLIAQHERSNPPGFSHSDQLHLRPTISRRFGDARFRHHSHIAVIFTTSS